jgi:ketosteroid isomerase-like protein
MQSFKESFDKGLKQFRAPVKDWPAFVASFYDVEAMVMPPDGPSVEGHQAILEFFRLFPPFSGHTQESVELFGMGDFVCSRDLFAVTLEPPGLAPIRQTGKALTIWKRQPDGAWKMFREIWNYDAPVAPSS